MMYFNLKAVNQVWFSTGKPSTIANPVKVAHEGQNPSFIAPIGEKGVRIELCTYNPNKAIVEGHFTDLWTNETNEVEFSEFSRKKNQIVFIGKSKGSMERVKWFLSVPIDK